MRDKKKKPTRDLLIRHPTDEKTVVRLKQDGRVGVGRVIDQKEGEEIKGEIISVHKTPFSPILNECETLFDPAEQGSSSGPPKVNSRAFRDNWDRIFGGKPDEEPMLN